MRKNTVKEALAEGKLQFGTGFGQLRSPEIPKLLAAAGFHWAFIDTEHGGFDLETVQDICRVSVMVGLSPIVRVADLQYSLIARAHDLGLTGGEGGGVPNASTEAAAAEPEPDKADGDKKGK